MKPDRTSEAYRILQRGRGATLKTPVASKAFGIDPDTTLLELYSSGLNAFRPSKTTLGSVLLNRTLTD